MFCNSQSSQIVYDDTVAAAKKSNGSASTEMIGTIGIGDRVRIITGMRGSGMMSV